MNTNPACRGILRDGQVGATKNACTNWGDYYLMEALARELFKTGTYW